MSSTLTPRTDEMIATAFAASGRWHDFARTLERELAAANAEVARMTKDRDEWKAKHWKAHDDFHRQFVAMEELRAEAFALRKANDLRIDEFLNEKICCNGVDCGCQGATRIEQLIWQEAGTRLTELRAANAALREAIIRVKRTWADGTEDEICEAILDAHSAALAGEDGK